jgi:protein SCO1/2
MSKHSYLAILFGILFLFLLWLKPFEQKGQTLDFTIETTQGTVTSSVLAGKTTLLYFGYTTCHAVCPMTLSSLNQALRRLSKTELDKLIVLFITIDKDDTLVAAQKYASNFHPAIVAGKADEKSLEMFTKRLNLKYNRNDTTKKIVHSGNIFIINSNIQLASVLPFGAEPNDILSAILPQIVNNLPVPKK